VNNSSRDVLSGATLPTIPAARLTLRWLTEADVGALFAIFSDPDVMRYWSSTPHQDLAATRRLLAEVQDGFRRRTLLEWGVALRGEDCVIGTCTLADLDFDNRRAEIGFALGRAHWGSGYMNEALTALLDFAFEGLDLHRIEADVDPRNAASIRALERLGFQREGLLRERWQVGGEIADSLFLGLLRDEWRARGQAAPAPVPLS